MKKYYLLIVCLLVTNIVFSQIKELAYLNPGQVQGVFKDNNKAFAFSFIEARPIDGMGIYQLTYFDDAATKLTIELSMNYSFIGSFEGKKIVYFVFANTNEKIIKIFCLQNGLIKEVSIPLQVAAEHYQVSYYQSFLLENDKLAMKVDYFIMDKAITQSYKFIEKGYDVYILNNESLQIEAKYHEVLSNQDFQSNIINVLNTSSGYVFMRELSLYNNKNYFIDLLFLDSKMNVLTSKKLTEEDRSFLPSELSYLNNKVVVIGNYMFGSVFKTTKPEGLFIKTFDNNGENEMSNEYNWLDLKAKLKESKKGRGDFVFNGSNKVIIQDVVVTGNGFNVICESYSYSAGFNPSEFILSDGNKEKVITVYDFVIFSFTNDASLQVVDIFEKEKSNIDITGYGSNYSKFLLAEQLKKLQVFPYQYFLDNEIHYISYKNDEGVFYKINLGNGNITSLNNVKLNPVIVEETNARSDEIIKNNGLLSSIEKLGTSMDKFGEKLENAGDKLDYSLNKVDASLSNFLYKSNGYKLLGNNQKCLYLMDNDRLSVFYQYID